MIRSDGSPERDFLYVEDAASAYLAIADALGRARVRGEAFNAGWGGPSRSGEVVDLICELGPDDVEPDYRAPETRAGRSTASTSTRRRSASGSAGSRGRPT